MIRKEDLRICLIEDEDLVRITIRDELIENGYSVEDFREPFEALEYISSYSPEIVLTDVRMPKLDGISVLKKVKEISESVTVIVMTAFGSVSAAVEALQLGAFNYLTKPFKFSQLENTLEKIAELKNLRSSNFEFKKHFTSKYNLQTIWGNSPNIQKVKDAIKLVAPSNSTVLVTGETGTGKEVVSNIIHYSSSRSDKPLIKVSCAILSEDVIESELFGHEKGAFTGAEKLRIGRFEEADSGTIYIDDIDDIPLSMQVKLLRVLQENEIERVGSSKTRNIDVRIIASTKSDLSVLVQQGKFREDLYYRLNVFPINIPPLRERPGDIEVLLKNFLRYNYSGAQYTMEDGVIEMLKKYSWPGNVRQLKNFVERCIILAQDGFIKKEMIPIEYCGQKSEPVNSVYEGLTLPEMVTKFETTAINSALKSNSGNQSAAANSLGIPLTTLRSKMEKYNIQP